MPEDTTYVYYTYKLEFGSGKVGIAITYTPYGECDDTWRLLIPLAIGSLEIAARLGVTVISMSFEDLKSIIWIPDDTDSVTILLMFEDEWDRTLYIDELRAVGIF